jgi:hypothetical protein
MIGWQTTEHGRGGLGLEGGLLSYAGTDFHKPKDEERLIKEIKRRKHLVRRN